MAFMHKESLKRATEFADGIKPLASKMGIKPNTISMWLKRGYTPTDEVINVSKAIDYQVTPHDLRPDIYPHPHDGLPQHLREVA